MMVSCVYEIQDLENDADPDKANLYFDDEVASYDEECAKKKILPKSDQFT
ncbi:MAG: hypothetical protein GY847_13920 [Proteobacteria bacterium]|nr:hypothetical protein [Pseudomonadota bacterium]